MNRHSFIFDSSNNTLYLLVMEQETHIVTELVQYFLGGIVSSWMTNGKFHDDLIQSFSINKLYRDGISPLRFSGL
jgi:hypothetical protein